MAADRLLRVRHGQAEIYYEVAAPGKPPTYHTVKAKLSPTEKHLISVLEVGDKKGSWRVWMDGKAVSPVISLPNSHGRFAPQAIGETWNAGTTTCNHYGYGFHDVQVATAPGGAWAAGVKGYVWTDSENTTKKVKNASFEARSVASTAPTDDGPPLLGALASRLAGRPLTVQCVSQEEPVREQPAGNLLLSRTVCERLLGYALAEPAAPRADSAAGVAVVLTALGFLRGVVPRRPRIGRPARLPGGRRALPGVPRARGDDRPGTRAALRASPRPGEDPSVARAPPELPDSLNASRRSSSRSGANDSLVGAALGLRQCSEMSFDWRCRTRFPLIAIAIAKKSGRVVAELPASSAPFTPW